MPFLKNIQFTQLIKIDGLLKEFNFRKPNGNPETMFTVDTIGDRGNRISFNMHRIENNWKISQATLPVWIFENESNLSDVILRELSSQDIYLQLPAQNSHWHFNRLLQAFGFN